MKRTLKKALSVVLALVMLLSVFSAGFYAVAQEQESVATPGIQTLLQDGAALKDYLETNFLSLEKADALLSESLPDLATLICSMAGDLFYQMGYNEAQYPTDQDSLILALARVLGSLSVETFREPEKVQTTDMSLVYNLAYIGGTQYVEQLNEELPAALRFNTSVPVLALSEEQKQTVITYYKKWQAGAIHLDDFDIKDYLGTMTPEQYLKTVLIVMIADDNRLPAITKKAIDFTIGTAQKAALAIAVADILDNLHTAPVSAILRQLSNPSFTAILRRLLTVADKVTLATDIYAYKLFQEGIYTDTNGASIKYIVRGDDGVYSYEGPGFLSTYIPAINALLDLLEGSFADLQQSVLETILSKRLEQLRTLAAELLNAVFATLGADRQRVEDDLLCAQIEKRFAQQQLNNISTGADQTARIASAQRQLDAVAAEIASLQAQLKELEAQEAVVKAQVQNYYEVYAAFEAEMTEDNRAEIEANGEYLAAKAKVEETEASLAGNYAEQQSLKAAIAVKSEKADALSTQILYLQTNYSPSDASAVYNKMLRQAEDKISECNSLLSGMASNEDIAALQAVLPDLLQQALGALDGVYDTMMNGTPIEAIAALVVGLGAFVKALEMTDWDAFAASGNLFEQLDGYIDSFAGRYVGAGGGENLLADLSETLNNLLTTYGVYDYIHTDYLNTFIATEILGDNSEVMQMAAAALGEVFAGVQPTYESIVSCLIPILSAFDFGAIMANMDSIGNSLSLASPSAFAYLAGLQSSDLQTNYLTQINQNLTDYGYTGTPVRPILSLSSTKQSSLLRYVQMEQAGTDLASIAAAGFNWQYYTDGANNLQIANAFIKMALGDSAKLGDIAAASGLGTALVNLLCDLLDDLKSAPVDTILKKLSNAEDLAAIADFAMGLLNGYDSTLMSYDLFFTQNIFYDAEGNTTFYDYVNDDGIVDYKGPRVMDYYVPIIAAGLDFLNNIHSLVKKNGGDLLKTLLFDKIPQVKNLVKSLISYQNVVGEEQAGLLFYLLMGYGDYVKSENTVLSYDLLIGLAKAAQEEQRNQMLAAEAEIALWEGYLAAIENNAAAAKLAKAKELGVVDESVAVYDEKAILAAIAAKAAQLGAELQALEAQQVQLEAAASAALQAYEEAKAASAAFTENMEAVWDGAFYEYLCTIFEDESTDALEDFREECAEEFDAQFGAGSFEALAQLIEEYLDIYAGDCDSFIEDCICGDSGLYLYERADELDSIATEKHNLLIEANQAVGDIAAQMETVGAEQLALESGAVWEQIQAATGSGVIYISNPSINAEGEYTAGDIEAIILNIRENTLVHYQSEIDAGQLRIREYTALKKAAAAQGNTFNAALVPLAASASDVLAQGVIDIITGNAADGSENVYYYIMNKNIADILTTGGRLQALFATIVGMVEPVLRVLVSEGFLESETAEQLIASVPNFDSFYRTELARFPEKFKQNPVGATGNLIAAAAETALGGFAAFEGELTHDAMQVKKINRDLMDIFDASFGSDWLQSYSKAILMRIGGLYQLLADILNLNFVRNAMKDEVCNTGTLQGKIDTSRLYADATVYLYEKEKLVAQVTVEKDSDGTFVFVDVQEGCYTLKLSTNASVPFEISSIDVIADAVTDLADSRQKEDALLSIPIGDISGDGTVGVDDVQIILLEENYGKESASCDINCDGVNDLADISIILSAGNFTAQSQARVY